MRKRNFYICTNEEIKQIACEYITSDVTLRELSIKYGLSRTTVHRYLRKALKEFDLDLAEQVNEVACRKKMEGQIRGGKAHKTKRRERWN